LFPTVFISRANTWEEVGAMKRAMQRKHQDNHMTLKMTAYVSTGWLGFSSTFTSNG